MKIIDITLPINSQIAGWQGDTPTQYTMKWSQATGASVNVGMLTISLHTGTHADAPFHFLSEGETAEQLPLEAFFGPVWVIDARGHNPIGLDTMEGISCAQTPRVLFRTDTWRDLTHFPESIPILSPDMPDYLASQGVVLVGFDLPSVDALDSRTLPIHHALYQQGIHVLEGLDLRHAEPGIYDLIALPLKIAGADGAPVRAALICK